MSSHGYPATLRHSHSHLQCILNTVAQHRIQHRQLLFCKICYEQTNLIVQEWTKWLIEISCSCWIKQVRFSNKTCESERETCISKGADASPQPKQTNMYDDDEVDASPQPKQTNLYQCGSEEIALTLVKKFGTKFVTDKQTDSGVYRHALACKNWKDQIQWN